MQGLPHGGLSGERSLVAGAGEAGGRDGGHPHRRVRAVLDPLLPGRAHRPPCACSLPPVWKSVFLWLGYSNSFFNPLIYTAFNKNYNSAFKSLFTKQR